jgi:ubiquinone/menaquinone biosynthesis C-methylase UbiE
MVGHGGCRAVVPEVGHRGAAVVPRSDQDTYGARQGLTWPTSWIVWRRDLVLRWGSGVAEESEWRCRSVGDETRAHYDHLAPVYDQNWAYSQDFLEWMSDCILARLRVKHGDRVVDVGCGTGLYARRLAEHAGTVVCVDPSARMLERIPDDPRLVVVQASAEDLASGSTVLPGGRFEAIVVKEAIHHIADRGGVIGGLATLLVPGGRFLIVMLPTSIEYPLFQAAHDRFRELQPDPQAIAVAMDDAGLAVELSYDDFPLAFPTDRYVAMVRGRYLSLLSLFNDEELAAGVAEIRRRYPGERVEFRDRFAFVLGVAS